MAANAIERAQSVVEKHDARSEILQEVAQPAEEKKESTMDLSIAQMLLASCKVKEQDRQYDNPEVDVPGCVPESDSALDDNIASGTQRKRSTQASTVNAVPKNKRITRIMRAHGVKRLEKFRRSMWMSADERTTGFFPPSAFLPDDTIQTILDVFALLKTVEDVRDLVHDNPLLDEKHVQLFNILSELRVDFARIRIETAEANKAKKLAKAATEAAGLGASESKSTGGVSDVLVVDGLDSEADASSADDGDGDVLVTEAGDDEDASQGSAGEHLEPRMPGQSLQAGASSEAPNLLALLDNAEVLQGTAPSEPLSTPLRRSTRLRK
ncbi:hypothetical protein PLICRDRAFT_33048 [Plicaturopsis crispa FD-325 SS-3]|uniref:Uncharacterized protein n=1 Tax=Plicaturopsis crispa FD-325 SS-3 TaxID=944288 RepID=A0A0C9SVP3_PLICR|nr:hypothetical protein PLICRDRAFT_33048 [Plicaturopsis crispa FD-325 SS-3]